MEAGSIISSHSDSVSRITEVQAERTSRNDAMQDPGLNWPLGTSIASTKKHVHGYEHEPSLDTNSQTTDVIFLTSL